MTRNFIYYKCTNSLKKLYYENKTKHYSTTLLLKKDHFVQKNVKIRTDRLTHSFLHSAHKPRENYRGRAIHHAYYEDLGSQAGAFP